MKQLYGVCMIHSFKSQGLSISKIARLSGCDRKTVRKYLARSGRAVAVRGVFVGAHRNVDDSAGIGSSAVAV